VDELELQRIEQGSPTPIGESVIGILMGLALLGLLAFIIFGVLL
jgi:hypothetical protein